MTDALLNSKATDNLLRNCAGLNPGNSLTIVHENPALGWYNEALVKAIVAAANEIGIETSTLEVGAPGNQRNVKVLTAIQDHDCTLFLSRIGDQDRFATPLPGKKIVMCYIRNLDMLNSSFGSAAYQAMVELKRALDQLINQAKYIEINCSAGTDCSLTQEARESTEAHDVTLSRFPMGVVTPIEAANLSGRVALADFLTPTGSRVYEPASLELPEPVFAILESGRITRFEGDPAGVTRVNHHYQEVAAQFAIDPWAVHSWHVGMHPGLSYLQPAAVNPDRWSNTVFNHPRILHFHTCGNYAPGEICWIVKDPTILLDGKPLWQRGVPLLTEFEKTRHCLEEWPQLKDLYAGEPGAIGI